ncbi:MAG: D-mannonate dehydratase, partial [Chloroflexi bacterium]
MTLPTIEPGLKIAAQMSPEPSEDDLKFVKQMGIDYAVLWTDASKSSYEYYASRRKLFADHGITVYGFGNRDVHNQDAIVLNLENRNAKVEQYKQHLRDLGKAGIPYTTYAHMANGIWSTERETTRGGASARAFDRAKSEKGHWAGTYYPTPYSHGRAYTQEEIWDNFTRFIQEVAPVAEEAGVKIGIHPDDPPEPELAGIPRCIFSSYDGYRRALEIADSPNVGICFCVGCWLKGGSL